MVKLAGDLNSLTSFMANPRKVLAKSGLGKEDQEALLSGDQNRIYWALSGAKPTPTPAAPSGGAQQAPPAVLPNVAPTISSGSVQHAPQVITAVVWLYQAVPPFHHVPSASFQGWPQFYYYPVPYSAAPDQPQPASPSPSTQADVKSQAGTGDKRSKKRESK